MGSTTDMKNEISKAQSQETFAHRSVRKNSLFSLDLFLITRKNLSAINHKSKEQIINAVFTGTKSTIEEKKE